MSYHTNISKPECKLLAQLSNNNIASATLFKAIALGHSEVYFCRRLYLFMLDLTHCIKAILSHMTKEQLQFF